PASSRPNRRLRRRCAASPPPATSCVRSWLAPTLPHAGPARPFDPLDPDGCGTWTLAGPGGSRWAEPRCVHPPPRGRDGTPEPAGRSLPRSGGPALRTAHRGSGDLRRAGPDGRGDGDGLRAQHRPRAALPPAAAALAVRAHTPG